MKKLSQMFAASRLRVAALIFAAIVPTFAIQAPQNPERLADFVDIAEKAGLTAKNVFGGVDTKKYIIETTGTGVAIFDYDNDGWPDIFIVNGTTLEAHHRRRRRPIISITTITTARSRTSRRRLDSVRPDGAKAFASATMTTMAWRISTSPTTEKIVCITTMATESFTDVARRPASREREKLGAWAAHLLTTTATAIWI